MNITHCSYINNIIVFQIINHCYYSVIVSILIHPIIYSCIFDPDKLICLYLFDMNQCGEYRPVFSHAFNIKYSHPIFPCRYLALLRSSTKNSQKLNYSLYFFMTKF